VSEISFSGSRDSLTVIVDGTSTVVRKGAVNFEKLRKALLEGDMAAVPSLLTVKKTIESWAQGLFRLADKTLMFKDKPVGKGIDKRVVAMITAGEDPAPLLAFYERLKKNPSMRSVESLWGFLQHAGIPIEPDGTFLAYKSVRADCRDHHSGQVDYTPSPAGEPPNIQTVERNEVSDDPRTPCHFGLHVGALKYARTFGSGGKIIICRIDPENVVCVPYDSNAEKMRVCELEVVGFWNGRAMPSTTMETDDRKDAREAKPVAPKKAKKTAKAKFEITAAVKATWAAMDKLDDVGLYEYSTDDLRKYATYHIKVVGASKIPGGKLSLARNIIEVREGGKK
jgi:hypothetical protein